jgi:hypothetical protein
LVTAGKHVNNTWAITRQLLGKWVPAATDILVTVKVLLDYNNGNGIFYVVRGFLSRRNEDQRSTNENHANQTEIKAGQEHLKEELLTKMDFQLEKWRTV